VATALGERFPSQSLRAPSSENNSSLQHGGLAGFAVHRDSPARIRGGKGSSVYASQTDRDALGDRGEAFTGARPLPHQPSEAKRGFR